jgi:AmiR/NasT family two-component response regulator
VTDSPELDECHENLEAAVDEAQHLRTAMETRAPIEQAKGILMTLIASCTEEDAFAVLVKVSQRSGVRLHDVAVKLCESVGESNKLPDEFLAASKLTPG